jgi:hypothetical protein
MATHYDTTNDPRHYTSKDGSVRPVTGTHEPGEECSVCANGKASARVLPEAFPLGALVTWDYGKGRTHGRVIAYGRTLVEVFWHTARRPRAIRRAPADLTRVPPAAGGWRRCASCEAGR